MEDGRLCRKCNSGESIITAFMLTCRHCKRHWHHSCLEPKMSDAELVSILQDLKTRADDEVWACRRCFLRNGGQPVEAIQRTSSQVLSAPSTSSKQIWQVTDHMAARKIIVAEVLDDEDYDDIVMLHDPPPSRIDTTAARTMVVTGVPDNDDDDIVLLDDLPRPRTNVTKNSGPQSIRPAVSVGSTSESDSPSGSIRHINFHSIPRPSNRPQQAQAGVQTRRIEDDAGISDVDLIEDSDGPQVAERRPTDRARGYSRSQPSVSGVPPSTTGFSDPPALPAYQSSLGPSNKRIAVSESATSSRASSSTTTSRLSTYNRSIPPTSPSASRSASLNTSFDQMNIEKRPSSVARSADGSLPSAISTPTSSTMSSRSNTLTPGPRDKTPMPVTIRERIAHMRAQGLLKPPPSILDDLTAISRIEHGTITGKEHSSVRGPRSDAEQVEVKLELRDSDEEIPTRSSAKAKGKRPVQLPMHAAPSLVRSVHSNAEFKDSDDEDDEWEELFDRVSTKRTRRLQEPSSATLRKSSAVKAKRLGPKARANTNKRALQWVMSSVPTDSRKRELPSWMI